MNKKSLLLAIIISAFVFTGCTRDVGDSASLKLQIPEEVTASNKVSTMNLNGYVLGHIVVNIQSPDMTFKRIWDWDANCEDTGCLAPPQEIIIPDVKEGPNRLIQFLGVYKNPTSQNMVFSYGDKVQAIVAGNNLVEITLTDLGINSGGEATIAGQYITGMDTATPIGPTGIVAVDFTPPNGSAAMTVNRAEMFNGYFNFFALKGIDLEYRLLNKLDDKSDDVILKFENSGQFYKLNFENLKTYVVPRAEDMIHIRTPDMYYVDHGGNDRDDNHGEEMLFGFVKAQDAIGFSPTTYYFSSDQALTNIYDSETGGSQLFWKISDAPGQFSYLGGGMGHGALNPTGEWQTSLMLNYENFGSGSREFSGFSGPFKLKGMDSFAHCAGSSADKTFVNVCIESSMFNIEFELINDKMISPTGISGVSAFYKKVPRCTDNNCNYSDMYRDKDSDGIRCNELQKLGFKKIKDITTYMGHEDIPFADFGFSIDNANEDVVVFACPYYENAIGNRFYFNSGVDAHISGIGGAGAGDDITLSGSYTENVTSTSFDVIVNYTGDNNGSAGLQVWYCNDTDDSGCDPTSTGTSYTMTYDSPGVHKAYISGLTAPNDPGDQINYAIVAADIDGVSGSPQPGNFILGDMQIILDSISSSSSTSNDFQITVAYNGDINNNSTALLKWCNLTLDAGCTPANDTAMSTNGAIYNYNNPSVGGGSGDLIKIQILFTDPDGVENPSIPPNNNFAETTFNLGGV